MKRRCNNLLKYFLKKIPLRNIIYNENGQSAVETAVSLLIFLTMILAVIQTILIAHAKLIVNYAAYSAARTGIVTNGNVRMMRKAAALACAPLNRGSYGLPSKAIGNTTNIDVIKGLLEYDWGINGEGGQGITVVRVLHPTANEIGNQSKINFDNYYSRGLSHNPTPEMHYPILTVQVTHFFKLQIPIINKVFAKFFPSQAAGGYKGIEASGLGMEDYTSIGQGKETPSVPISDETESKNTWDKKQETRIVNVIKQESVGGKEGGMGYQQLRIPLTSHYTMRMQTDLIPSKLNDPPYFTLADLPANDAEMQKILENKTPVPYIERQTKNLSELKSKAQELKGSLMN